MFKGVGVTPKKAFSPLISHGMSGMWWSNEILADKQTLRITLKKAANKYAVKKYVAEHSLQKSKDNWQVVPIDNTPYAVQEHVAQVLHQRQLEETFEEQTKPCQGEVEMPNLDLACSKHCNLPHSPCPGKATGALSGCYTMQNFPGPSQLILKVLQNAENSEALQAYKGLDKEAGQTWCKHDCIGKGTFGSVRCFVAKKSLTEVAIKKLHETNLPQFLHEVAMCEYVKGCHFVLTILDAFYACKSGFLVFDHGGINLRDFQRQRKSVNAKAIMHQVLKGLFFLHNNKVLHTDLKPANILVKETGSGSEPGSCSVQIADFGSAQLMGEALSPKELSDRDVKKRGIHVTTLYYRAPEVLLGDKHFSYPIDVWSAGCILYEIASGGRIYFQPNQRTQKAMIHKVFSKRGTPVKCRYLTSLPHWPEDLPRYSPQPLPEHIIQVLGEGQDLLNCMLEYNPESRIDVSQTVDHPYFCNDTPSPPTSDSANDVEFIESRDLGERSPIKTKCVGTALHSATKQIALQDLACIKCTHSFTQRGL